MQTHGSRGQLILLTLIVVLGWGLPSPGQTPPIHPDLMPRYNLGVGLEDVSITYNGSSPFRAVRISWVRLGSAAARAGVLPDDLVVWANNERITTYSRLQDAVARSGGSIRLGLIHAGNGQFSTVGPIGLGEDAVAGLIAEQKRMVQVSRSSIRPVELQIDAAPQAPSKVAPVAQAPAGGPGGGGGTRPNRPGGAPAGGGYGNRPAYPGGSGFPHRLETQNGARPGGEFAPPPPPPSAGDRPVIDSSIPLFQWPPPKYSSSTVVPDNLVHKPGTDESLFAVAKRLEDAFRQAGYGQLSYYAIPDGFAMATRLEQFGGDGGILPAAQRWSVDVAAPRVFSLKSYFMALFGANKGHFRVIVLAVTSAPAAPNTKVSVTRDIASLWPTAGAPSLPSAYKSIRYVDDDYHCTALIYEFELSGPDDPPEFKNPGLDARIQLEKASVFTGFGQ